MKHQEHLRHGLLLLGATLLIFGGMPLSVTSEAAAQQDPAAILASLAQPISDADDLAPMIEEAKDKRFVLLGEASHGTSEFYTWRADISRTLIKEHGFNYIAVEGDWDACYELNRYVKDMPGAAESAEAALKTFDRWPLWMWANREVEALVTWLREYNDQQPEDKKVGFYGIDVYGFEGSFKEAVAYLQSLECDASGEAAKAILECLTPYIADPHDYARAVMLGAADCAPPAEAAVALLREQTDTLREQDAAAWFNGKQHALVVRNAERHYRAMASRDGNSWNERVFHFHQTVERLDDFYGPDAKGIVWAHNTHIGDARATSMINANRYNIGQLLRQEHGDASVYAVGFGTHRGTVLAGSQWGAAMQRMPTPPARRGSLEYMLNEIGHETLLLLLASAREGGLLTDPLPHRAIGVTFDPAQEQRNYVPTVVPRRYDAFIFIAETQPLDPIHD